MDAKRLVIVEDDTVVGTLLTDALAQIGHLIVGLGHSLSEGLALVQASSFDCAVVDVDLGGMQAWPLIGLLDTQGIPCVVITGLLPGDMEAQPCARMPLLIKPFSCTELIAAIESALLNVKEPRSHHTQSPA